MGQPRTRVLPLSARGTLPWIFNSGRIDRTTLISIMSTNYESELRQHIDALSAMGNELLPVIKDEQNEKLASGKVPSYILPSGSSKLIQGREGWEPSKLAQQIELAKKLKKDIGIAVKPPEGLVIIDLDAKNYPGGEGELIADYSRLAAKCPSLKQTRVERTTNGGLHIYARVSNLTKWKKQDGGLLKAFTTSQDGPLRGELLASNSICITAPSYGSYKLVSDSDSASTAVTVETLEACGIYPRTARHQPSQATAPKTISTTASLNIKLRELLSTKAKRVLYGEYAYSDSNTPKRDRSLQLTCFAKEVYGVENLTREHGIILWETAEDLIEEVVAVFRLEDKASRVLDPIRSSQHTWKASNPGYVKDQLGITGVKSSKKPPITADLARSELEKALGQIRQRIRTGEIVLPNGELIGPDKASRMYLELSASTNYQWNKVITKDAITDIAEENQFDHIKEHFLELASSNAPLQDSDWYRLDQFLFGIDDPIAAMFMPKYLIGAVSRLMQPGCPYVPTPILVGGQGSRKSDLVKALFGADYVTQGIKTKLDKDDISKIHRFFCLELAEFDGFTKNADRERLKEFLTTTEDTYRPVWKEGEVTRPRSFVFWGNANNIPLDDPTGNRRYVAIDINEKSHSDQLPLDRIKKHREAIWSRAFFEYNHGTTYHFSAQEQTQVNESNKLSTNVDSWQEKLAERLGYDPKHTYLNTSDAFEILRIDLSQQSRSNQHRIATILKALGYTKRRIKTENGKRSDHFTRVIDPSVKQRRVSVSECIKPFS